MAIFGAIFGSTFKDEEYNEKQRNDQNRKYGNVELLHMHWYRISPSLSLTLWRECKWPTGRRLCRINWHGRAMRHWSLCHSLTALADIPGDCVCLSSLRALLLPPPLFQFYTISPHPSFPAPLFAGAFCTSQFLCFPPCATPLIVFWLFFATMFVIYPRFGFLLTWWDAFKL